MYNSSDELYTFKTFDRFGRSIFIFMENLSNLTNEFYAQKLIIWKIICRDKSYIFNFLLTLALGRRAAENYKSV